MAKRFLLFSAVAIGLSFGAAELASAAPLGAPRLADSALVSSEASDLVIKTQGRRGGGGRVGVRPGGGRFVGGGGRGWRGGGGRGLSTGAAVGIGVGAAALGILGAAAAANSAPAYPVYGGSCYIARQPMYDNWGNYIGRRRVRVCN